MKIGVGYRNAADALSAGREVAEEAVRSGGLDRPSLVLAFCGGPLPHDDFFAGLRSVVGVDTPVVGGSAIGLITNEHLSYEGYPAGAAVIQLDGAACRVASAGDLDRGERAAGKKLATALADMSRAKLMLLFYDSIRNPPTETAPPVMNASPALIQGLEASLPAGVPIIGAGLVGDFQFHRTRQFCGDRVGEQTAVGVLLEGGFEAYTRIMHGCTPKDGVYHRITKIRGAVIHEVDGRPIVDLIDEMYAGRAWRKQFPVKRLTVGVNKGEKFAPYRESEYVNRLIAGVLPGGEGVVLFEPDLEEGAEIQFMLRDGGKMIASAKRNATDLIARIKADGRKAVFGFYIDCAGRSAAFSDTLTEEAAEIQKVCNENDIPLLGFYSGVEIAPLLGKNRGLDWTGVLLMLTA